MASSNSELPASSDDIIPRTKSWTADARGNPSSTPPPGFVASGLWSKNSGTAGDASSTGGQARQERRHNERTSSFNNIAAALGNVLAESIEDATRGDHTSNSRHAHDVNRNHNNTSNGAIAHSNSNLNLTDNFFNPSKNNDMTYERHKRHAASRLLGVAGASSSAPISHKAPEAGSLFGALDPAEAHRQSFFSRNRVNHTSDKNDISSSNNNNDDGCRSGGLESSSMASAPFPHDPTAAAFHPSYQTTTAKSPLQFNSNHKNNTVDVQRKDHSKSRLPVTKDLGCTVMEPSDSPYGGGGSNIATHNLSNAYGLNRVAKPDVDATYGIQPDMQKLNLWSESGGMGGESNRSGDSINGGSGGDGDGGEGNRRQESVLQAVDGEEELRPFTWDINHHEPSRTLAILMASAIPSNEIVSLCETFGVTETFRSEFLERVGVVFISYFDMRCAQFAAMQLPGRLQRLVGAGAGGVEVKFCVPLNSSSQNDDSLVVINDLPNQIGADNLGRILSSFGAIRSLKSLGGSTYGGSSYVAEFHDVQDAKKVVFELESTQPWGPDVSIEVGGRNPADRKKGRELLALLGRWRNLRGGGKLNRGRQAGTAADTYRPHVDSRGMAHRVDGRYERGLPHEEHSPQLGYGPGPQDGRYPYGGNAYVVRHQHPGYPQYRGPHHPSDHVVHGSHGHHGTYVTRQVSHQPPPHQQQFYQQPQQVNHGNFPGGSSVASGGSSRHTGASGYYTDDRSIGSHNSNLRSVNSLVDSMAGNTRDGQSQHLILDLDAVENGLDTRTSLMVRNIPNKYTQQMLLTEFTENDHGPGIIDFFYLPIDFKNRCNRGYAFINFVDYHDILNFHRQYYGQHWRTFNSDKICDITYARIQGKAAMLKRFENSALMEKDEEYKPLVFVSNGPDRGSRLPFPDSSRGDRSTPTPKLATLH